ncbi:MAG: CoA-binding protein, partial [Candidatus Ranarchaeia archaeon]
MSLEPFFKPKSIAVIGASSRPGNLGRSIMEKMLEAFKSHLYPVNPNCSSVLGLPCFPRLMDLPERPDLAIVIVPSRFVIDVVKEAAKLEVPAIIIISAGFRESGHADREKQLLEYKGGSRILGPNCLGIVDRHTGVNTLFPSNPLPEPGNVGLILQSGAFGIDIIVKFYLEGISLSKYISYGNAVDIKETELLEYLTNDKDTEVIAMYLEGVLDPRFREVASEATRVKPVIGLVAGGGFVGKATSSHTGTLATDIKIFEGVFRQLGIHKVNTT